MFKIKFTSHTYYNDLQTNSNSQYAVTKPTVTKQTVIKPTVTKPTVTKPTVTKPTVTNCIELFKSIQIEDTEINNTIIPRYVFQTWKHTLLSKDMKDNILQLRKNNPEFEYFLYDDKMCREFIQTHFGSNELYAFDSLIPGAYKADLWRYCVLYIYGGVYMDIKLNTVQNFKLKSIIHEECFPIDINNANNKGIWQGFLICKPQNEILKHCIDEIIKNVKQCYYGDTCLSVTGPGLVYNALIRYNNIKLYNNSKVKLVRKTRLYLIYNNKPIIQFYDGYGKDKKILGPPYGTLWQKRMIYK
jgi:mannosyltransferase OCH1-like enzyme